MHLCLMSTIPLPLMKRRQTEEKYKSLGFTLTIFNFSFSFIYFKMFSNSAPRRKINKNRKFSLLWIRKYSFSKWHKGKPKTRRIYTVKMEKRDTIKLDNDEKRWNVLQYTVVKLNIEFSEKINQFLCVVFLFFL